MPTLPDDLTCFDGLEPITLRQPGAVAPESLPQSLRRAVTTREAQESRGAYTTADVKWRISAVDHAAAPQVGAVISDAAGAQWSVLCVERQAVTQAWVCWCRRLELAAALSEVVTIQRATWTTGPSGAPVAAWEDDLTDVAARIQPVAGVIEVQHERRTVRVTHKIYVALPAPVDGNLRVVHGTHTYNIVGFDALERLGELPVLLAELTPWPLSVA